MLNLSPVSVLKNSAGFVLRGEDGRLVGGRNFKLYRDEAEAQAAADLENERRAKARRIEERAVRSYAAAEALVKTLPGVSIGYIGNVYLDGTDDRSWSIFLPHPGRVGTSADRIGNFPTSERGTLLSLANALVAGYRLAGRVEA